MRILVVKMSALGDLFHALPAAHGLKLGTGAVLDWVAHGEYAPLVECFTDVDRVVSFPRRRFAAGFNAFLRELRAMEYDYVIDFQGLFKSGLVTRLARGKRRIGPSFHRECSRVFYTGIFGSRDRSRHAVEECMDILDFLGLDRVEPEFPVVFPEAKLNARSPRVAMITGSRWRTKIWPADRFGEVARQLIDSAGATVCFLGGPTEREECGKMAGKLGANAINLAGSTTLPELGGVLKEMDLLVSNDTGPAHIAAAVGTPVLAVFGPTDPSRTGPYGQGHRIVRAEIECRPCFSRKCRKPGPPCLAGIAVADVARTALEMLGVK